MKRNFKLLNTLVISAMLFAAFSPAVALADPIPPTDGDDFITGDETVGDANNQTENNGDQTLFGRDGNDILIGDNGSVFGENGSLNNGDDLLVGGNGNDILVGDTGVLNGGLFTISNGNDTLAGGAGDDILYGDTRMNFAEDYTMTDGNDRLNGGTGNDELHGGGGTDTVEVDLLGNQHANLSDSELNITDPGDAGFHETDTLYSIEQATIYGGNQDNSVDVSTFSGTTYISGAEGDDTIIGSNQDDELIGGDGDDSISGNGGDDIINGGDGTDLVEGNSGNDTLNGGNGDDYIYGGEGNDTIDGGAGMDSVWQFVDADQTYYASGLLTGQGTDLLSNIEQLNLSGASSNNIIDASAFTGYSNIYGGGGDDTLTASSNLSYIAGAEGNDTIYGGISNDTLYGNSGNDTIHAGAGNDKIYGGSGNDTIDGGAGADSIAGGDGDDVITSNAGNDLIQGNEGNDTFIFGSTDINTDTQAFGNEGQNIFRFEAGTQGHYELTTESEEDTLDFSNYDQPVNIDLSNNSEQEVSAGLWLTLNGFFKNLFGSEQDDVLVGNDLNNNISANGGNDRLDGNGGTNILDGGDGTDEEINPDPANTQISIELPVPSSSTPIETPVANTFNGTIPVTGGNMQTLQCPAGINEVTLQLDSGDQVRFVGLCDLDASIDKLDENALPGDLPTDSTFVTDLLVQITDDGTPLNSVSSGSIEISFAVPAEAQGKSLSLLHWDETSSIWTEIPLDNITTNTASATIRNNISGLFVLVEN